MKLFFIRHAQAACNEEDDNQIMIGYNRNSPLTEFGKQQAQLLGENFYPEIIPDIVYTSPLLRAVDTCRFFCDYRNIEYIVDERLAEVKAPEVFLHPITYEEWDAIFEKRNIYTKERFYDIESLEEHYNRTKEFIMDIENMSYDNVVIFTHAYTIEMALLYFVGGPMDGLNRFRFRISNTGIFCIEINPHGYYLRIANGLQHFRYNT